ncbi:MAG: NADP-dependent oxidoreductase [Myxococcales bacterium]
MMNTQIVLASRPKGWVEEANFRTVKTEVRPIRDGEVLTRVRFLSLDPYMRGRMEETRSYAPPQPIGEVMIGGTVAEVIESKNPRFKAGDVVLGMAGWQEYQATDGSMLRALDTSAIPASAYLGCMGMPGVTAWYGLTRIGAAKPGETVLVSAASGAVGSVVGQLARLRGCRAVGIAGGKAKCEHVVRDLGFDACVDYRAPSFVQDLEAATPARVDVVFENVGGKVLDAALARMNAFGRVAVCGLIAGYNGQEMAVANLRSVLTNRLLVQGFIVSEHLELWPQAQAELGAHVAAGRIRYRETIAQGIEAAPRAFIGLLKGENLGKQLVKVS